MNEPSVLFEASILVFIGADGPEQTVMVQSSDSSDMRGVFEQLVATSRGLA